MDAFYAVLELYKQDADSMAGWVLVLYYSFILCQMYLLLIVITKFASLIKASRSQVKDKDPRAQNIVIKDYRSLNVSVEDTSALNRLEKSLEYICGITCKGPGSGNSISYSDAEWLKKAILEKHKQG